jgi:hypothetical protein
MEMAALHINCKRLLSNDIKLVAKYDNDAHSAKTAIKPNVSLAYCQ